MMTEDLKARILARLHRLTEEYPEAWRLCHTHIDLFGRPTGVSEAQALRFQFLATWALFTEVDARIGNNGKRGDLRRKSMDVFAFLLSDNVRDVQIIDFVANAGINPEYASGLARGEGIPRKPDGSFDLDVIHPRYHAQLKETGGIRHPTAFIHWQDVTEISRPHGGGIWIQPVKPAEWRGSTPGPAPGPAPGPVDDRPSYGEWLDAWDHIVTFATTHLNRAPLGRELGHWSFMLAWDRPRKTIADVFDDISARSPAPAPPQTPPPTPEPAESIIDAIIRAIFGRRP